MEVWAGIVVVFLQQGRSNGAGLPKGCSMWSKHRVGRGIDLLVADDGLLGGNRRRFDQPNLSRWISSTSKEMDRKVGLA